MAGLLYTTGEPEWSAGEYFYVIAHRTADGWARPSKVGIAMSPPSRLSALQCGNPDPIGLFGVIKLDNRKLSGSVERFMKWSLRDCRRLGEWYDAEPIEVFETAALHVGMSIHETRLCDVETAIATTASLARLLPLPGVAV